MEVDESVKPCKPRRERSLESNPAHKAAKNHLKSLALLGYNSFKDTGLPYNEERIPGETDGELNARRQAECRKMAEFIRRATVRKSLEKTQTQPLDNESNTQTKHPAASTPPAAAVGSKRPYHTTDEDSRPPKKGSLDPYKRIQADLEKERNSRKKLEMQIQALISKIDQMQSTITTLTTELQKERKKNATLDREMQHLKKPAPNAVLPESSGISMETVRALIAESLAPILGTLQNQANPNAPKKKGQPAKHRLQTRLQIDKTPSAPTYANAASPQSTSGPVSTDAGPSGASATLPHHPPTTAASDQATRTPQTPTEDQEPGEFVTPRYLLKKEQRKKTQEQSNSPANNQQQQPKKKRRLRPAKVKPNTLLLLPNEGTPNVLQRLQNMPEADPQKLGVKRHVQFPSGAVLVACNTQEQAAELSQIATSQGIAIKARKEVPFTARIHGLPSNTTKEQVREAICGKLKAEVTVKIVAYKVAKGNETHFAIVTTDKAGWDRITKAKMLRLGWHNCRIDSSIHVSRCGKCHLLGHSETKCQNIDTAPPEPNTCKDCLHYNNMQKTATTQSGVRARPRDTRHATGSKTCPTLLSMKRKSTPTQPATAGPSQQE